MAKVKDFFRRLLVGDRQTVNRRLTGPDPTAGYQNRRYDLDDIIINELPHWNYRVARMMLWDPVVILGLLTRNAAIAPAKLEVECKDARVREYIGRLWQTLWGKYSSVLLRTKHFGYAGFQTEFCRNDETQTIDLESIKEFDPLDIRVRLHAGQPVGFRVISNQSLAADQEPGQNVPILFGPRGVLLRYNAIAGKPSGNSILRGAYSPWYSKWMPGGAVKIKQLRMMKDAYLGDIFEYPYDRSVTDHNGNEIPWRDILREVAEARRTGAAMFLPSLYNTEGQKLVNYTPPQDTGDPKAIFEWVDQEDRDIWRGLGVFEEVIQASETGSGFSGRSVPMAMFLESCQEEVCDIVASVDTFLFQPLVWHNFGEIKYSVKPAQLLDIWGEKMGGTSMGGQAAGGGPQAPPPGQQGDEAEPKGPQPPQQPKSGKPPVQFAEPLAETEAAWLAPIVDYAQSDIIAARMAAAVQGAFRISAGELWAEMRRQVPAGGRKGFTGAAAALLVGGAVAAILMRKRERAQEIVEDGLFAAAIVGAGAAQEQIDFIELPSTSKAETSAPASTAAVRTQPVTDPVTANPQNTGISEAFPPVPVTNRQPVPATGLPSPQLETVVVTPSAPSVPAAPPILTPQPEPLPLPAPPQPPQGKIPSTMDTFGRRRRIRFPTEEEARKKLRGATALAGQNYRETAQFVKQDAFAITTRMSDDMVAKIRDELESNMAKGMDLRAFVKRVEAIQRGEQFPLSRARIELVFRANTARYLSDAQDASLRHPLVADQFPYRAYAATHDDRVRDTHLRLEQTGLNGTNIYRATDPAWKAFRPPWAYNDRCSWRPVTVRQAARIGVVEANRWLGAAQAVAQVQGGLADQYLKGTAPQQPEFVPWPSIDGQPFYPSPEWSRDGVQFSEVETAAKQTDANPTDAQREAGNYRKGKLRWNGLTISIETPKGARRRPEWPPLRSHYGYINSTEGVDGDHVDVFVRDNPESDVVYVIDQCNADGSFDEHKVMIGWTEQKKAKRDYLANYTDGWKCGPITAMTVDQFKAWLKSHDAGKPAAESLYAQFRERWITVGGHKVGNKNHVGGTPIKIGDDGDVVEPRSDKKGKSDGKEEKPKPERTPLEKFTDRTSQILAEAGYEGLLDDHERADRARKAGARPEAYAHTLITDHEASLAPQTDNDGGSGPTRMPRKGTKLYKQIADAVGDDPQDIGYFSEVLYDVLGQQQAAASEYNELFDDLRDNFVSDKRGRAGGFATQLARAQDPSEVPGFDEMVQYVRDNPRIRSILSTGSDESEGDDDVESRLFEALKAGKKRVPTLNDKEVWREAHDIVESAKAGVASDVDWSTVDFSEDQQPHWIVVYRQFAEQRGLFGGTYDDKPKHKPATFDNAPGKQSAFWTGLDLAPGQRDFLDEMGDDITEDTRAKKPVKSKNSEERWITIGGHPEGDKKHAGGTPVKIDGEGNIKAGPEALAKQGIKKLSDFGDKKDKKKPEKYDDSPKATGERIKEALKNAEGPMSLNELGKLIGVPAAKEDDPLSSPLNRAIVALRDSGDIETVESESGKGEDEPGPKEDQPKDDQQEYTAPGVTADMIPYDRAMNAYRGTSFSPEKRAKDAQKGFADDLQQSYNNLSAMADTDEKKSILEEEWPRYAERTKNAYLAKLDADSRTMSSMITGPANFPTRSNQKKLESAHKRLDEYLEQTKKGYDAIAKKINPPEAPARIGDKGTGDALANNIAEREKRQDIMKRANAVVRKFVDAKSTTRDAVSFKAGKTQDDAMAALQAEFGEELKESTLRQLLVPDFAGRVGFPDYEIKNNSAEIRRLKARQVAQGRYEQEAEAADGEASHEFDGGKVDLNYEENRIQIKHNHKPDAATIQALKSNGFRWSPSNGAWQRQLTNAAKAAAMRITGVKFGNSAEQFSEDLTHYIDWDAEL